MQKYKMEGGRKLIYYGLMLLTLGTGYFLKLIIQKAIIDALNSEV